MDALALILLRDFFLNHGIKVAQESVVPDEKVGLAAESMEHASHFYCNIAGAYDGDFFRLFLKIEEAVRRYAEITTRNLLGNIWVASGSKKDFLCSNGFFAAVIEDNLGFILRDQASTAMDVLNFVISEILLVYTVQAFDVCISFLLECFPVKRGCLFDRKAVCGSVVDRLCYRSSIPSDFLRNTSRISSISC